MGIIRPWRKDGDKKDKVKTRQSNTRERLRGNTCRGKGDGGKLLPGKHLWSIFARVQIKLKKNTL